MIPGMGKLVNYEDYIVSLLPHHCDIWHDENTKHICLFFAVFKESYDPNDAIPSFYDLKFLAVIFIF
jgi:hypothetical protein